MCITVHYPLYEHKNKATADRTSQEVAKVLTQPEMVQLLVGFNVEAKASTPAQLALERCDRQGGLDASVKQLI